MIDIYIIEFRNTEYGFKANSLNASFSRQKKVKWEKSGNYYFSPQWYYLNDEC